ncbi:MAG TPA: nucleotidyltransferase domain-containing protein [Pyrinomonadaceae bacterium]|nr:nucleotidyltransferase domain-containing protein [Pyrinomonadaceae bacterium]
MDAHTTDLLNEIKRRILAVSDPEQIILFGSHARGNAGLGSDVDLLVIEEGLEATRRESVRLRSALRGLLVPVDVMVATPQQVERYRNAIGLIYGSILREGKVIYERAANA